MNVRDKKLKWIDPILRPISRSTISAIGGCKDGTAVGANCEGGLSAANKCEDGANPRRGVSPDANSRHK